MGLFDKLKSQREIAKEELIEVPWHQLQDITQLDSIVEESKQMPVAIFKHSTRCGISRMVLRQFEKGYKFEDSQIKLYFLDLLAHRNISNEIVDRFGVAHESPQIILLKNEKVVHHDSHNSIEPEHLQRFI